MKAALHIVVAVRKGISYLRQSYFTPPFKLANITEDKRSGGLHLMQMSSSPGILDNDEYDVRITVEDNACLQLHTQSYLRLFSMTTGASQSMQVAVGQGACLTYLPHPSVPHGQSIFTAKNKINLSKDSILIWGEIFTCGRNLNGEVFLFTKYHNTTKIFIDGRMVIKENLLMQPAITNVRAMGQLEGYTHQASFIYLNEKASIKPLLDGVYDFLNRQEHILFGVTAAPVNGMVVRILGYKAEQLHQLLNNIAEIIKDMNG